MWAPMSTGRFFFAAVVSLMRQQLAQASGVRQAAAVPICNTSTTVGRFGQPDGFADPLLVSDARGDRVLFMGTFANTVAYLVYQQAEGKLLCNVSVGSESSGETALTFKGFGAYGFSAGRQESLLVFVATAAQPAGATVDGIFLQKGDTQGPVPLVLSGEEFKPAGAAFTGFNSPTVAETSTSIVMSFLGLAGSSWTGVVFGESSLSGRAPGMQLTLVADQSTAIPHKPGYAMSCLSNPVASATGAVAFFASHCIVSSPVASEFADLTYSRGRGQRGNVRFRSKLGASVGNHIYPAIYTWSKSKGLAAAADSTMPVPGGSDPSERFVAFGSPAIGRDGTVAFVGLTNMSREGVFVSSGGKLDVVADTTTTMPGSGGELFGNFPYVPSVGQQGEVLFYGSSLSTAGVFAGSAGGAGLRNELLLSDTVQGQPIDYISFSGPSAYSEATDTFAAYLVLTDANMTDGVWAFPRKQREAGMITI